MILFVMYLSNAWLTIRITRHSDVQKTYPIPIEKTKDAIISIRILRKLFCLKMKACTNISIHQIHAFIKMHHIEFFPQDISNAHTKVCIITL